MAELNKVAVIGSGPIVIGQAAEFDYSGTQACRSLKEEGLEVVLINPNPATIMTDDGTADAVYMEPLTVEYVARILWRERPQGLLPTLGGQAGLNLARELAESGLLEELKIRLLGSSLTAIQKAEDRELFRLMLGEIGEPVLESKAVTTVEDALNFAETLGYPVVVRPAYTLGGSGGGFAYNPKELARLARGGLYASPIGQVLVERSVMGYKEIEYEVLRDAADNCITICNMENIDPVGVHTGDSMVVAPSQTLSDKEYQMLRSSALKIIRALGIEGGCNVQFALDPLSFQYYVIEVNPRVSRSSALASKATGYPIAKVAAKVAVGRTLDEVLNPVTGQTTACYEPALDYVVIKLARFPFDKFHEADRTLGTQMKATGEVMALGRTLEEALGKAFRSLETEFAGFETMEEAELTRLLAVANDRRLPALWEALRRGRETAEVSRCTGIDPFFVTKMARVVSLEQAIAREGPVPSLLRRAKAGGISNQRLARILHTDEAAVARLLAQEGIKPVYKLVDTCAGEFKAVTPYFYSSYDAEDEVEIPRGSRMVVLGSGPIRIGQGIEFDYCSVQAVKALKEAGCQAVIINNNPETVSTDFDTADRLYFEPLAWEDVEQVLGKEDPDGVLVQFGGQTSLNLAERVQKAGYRILGTSLGNMDLAEDRQKFQRVLDELGIASPPGATVFSPEEALQAADKIGYPVLIRPSYVLGGRAMQTVYHPAELTEYLAEAVQVSPRHPVWIDKYLPGIEVEVDLVSDGEDVLIPGIMEHVERAGVHSGDSIAAYPPLNLSSITRNRVVECATSLARKLQVVGLLNIQFVIHQDQVYVIEANPRASRTVPVLTKVTGVPLVSLAVRVMLGAKLATLGFGTGLRPHPGYVTVKVPVFSFHKLAGVETSLGPEMKSTGEVIGLGPDFAGALKKGLLAAGVKIPQRGNILATVADRDKKELMPFLAGLNHLGFKFYATRGTSRALEELGVETVALPKLSEGSEDIVEILRDRKIDLVVNTPSHGREKDRDGFRIRQAAAERNIPVFTSPDTVRALYKILQGGRDRQVPIYHYGDLAALRPPAAEKAGIR